MTPKLVRGSDSASPPDCHFRPARIGQALGFVGILLALPSSRYPVVSLDTLATYYSDSNFYRN